MYGFKFRLCVKKHYLPGITLSTSQGLPVYTAMNSEWVEQTFFLSFLLQCNTVVSAVRGHFL